ncbi:unnamed protein product [Choristocarpus tenellus]
MSSTTSHCFLLNAALMVHQSRLATFTTTSLWTPARAFCGAYPSSRQRHGTRLALRGEGERMEDLAHNIRPPRRSTPPVSTDEVSPKARLLAEEQVIAYVPQTPTEGDVRCIEERQLRHKTSAIAVSGHCRHGFPQAFGFSPCGHKISSGLFRLSCPMLVQAIDSLESEGGIEHINERLELEPDLREDFMAVNLVHGGLRKRLMSPGDLKSVSDYLGSDEIAMTFLGSGITGVTPSKVRDAKCLHAHVADALMRGRGKNAIGRATLELLEQRAGGEEGSMGNGLCNQQCDVNLEETESSWRYMPQKNRLGLKLKNMRRREQQQSRLKKQKLEELMMQEREGMEEVVNGSVGLGPSNVSPKGCSSGEGLVVASTVRAQ